MSSRASLIPAFAGRWGPGISAVKAPRTRQRSLGFDPVGLARDDGVGQQPISMTLPQCSVCKSEGNATFLVDLRCSLSEWLGTTRPNHAAHGSIDARIATPTQRSRANVAAFW